MPDQEFLCPMFCYNVGSRACMKKLCENISVVIPTRDRWPLLARALRSVFAQTHRAKQVIVVDDGSAVDMRAPLQQEFPQVEVLRQDHAGVSAARNRGIAAARCDWIALLDSDDEWMPRKLERQMLALDAKRQARESGETTRKERRFYLSGLSPALRHISVFGRGQTLSVNGGRGF
jgi:glycosyltransferase involved in cell wall biosynthesis